MFHNPTEQYSMMHFKNCFFFAMYFKDTTEAGDTLLKKCFPSCY